VVASNAAAEEAGNDEYRDDHMAAIFQEGLSFSGFERNYLALNLGGHRTSGPMADTVAGGELAPPPSPTYLGISGISGVDSLGDGRGAAFADFDNDGDLDIFQVNLQGNAHQLFRNNVGQDGNFIRIELEGTASGRDAFGAVVRVATSAGVLTKVKSGGSGFLAQHDPRLLFGLGAGTHTEWVEITWPSGMVQRLANLPAGTSVHVVESGTTTRLSDEPRFQLVDPLSPEDALLAKLTLARDQPLPDQRLEDFDGGIDSLHALLRPGRRTLLNIWATWCIPCRKEMPELQSLVPRLDAVGIDLIGLSLDVERREAVPAFMASLDVTYPSYFADVDAVAAWYRDEPVFVPISILVDERGNLLRAFSGWSPQTAADLEGLIAAGEAGR
jgi:thiol-disulfide isomerase/thioredoxin